MLIREQSCIIPKIACAITGDNDYKLQLGVGINDVDLRSLAKDRPLRLNLIDAHGTHAENLAIWERALHRAAYQWFPDHQDSTVPGAELRRAVQHISLQHDVFWHDAHGIYFVTAAFFERCRRDLGKITLVLAQSGNPRDYGTVTIYNKSLEKLPIITSDSPTALKLRVALHHSAINYAKRAPLWYDFRLAREADDTAELRVYEFSAVRRIGLDEQIGDRREYRLSDAESVSLGSDQSAYRVETRELVGEIVFESIYRD